MLINKPEIVEELYVQKNRYFDKYPKTKTMFYPIFGDSMLFDKSDKLWSDKRKSLSAAFYKEKMIAMLRTIIAVTNKKT